MTKRHLTLLLLVMLILSLTACVTTKAKPDTANANKAKMLLTEGGTAPLTTYAEEEIQNFASPPEDTMITDSGLAYQMLKTNPNGEAIKNTDLVSLHFNLKTKDMDYYDSKESIGMPMVFTANGLLYWMKEAVFLAKSGEKIRAWLPATTMGSLDQSSFIFEAEIIEVQTPMMPPRDIPKDAIRLDSGVAYHITKPKPEGKQIGEGDALTLVFNSWLQEDGSLDQSSKTNDIYMMHPLALGKNSLYFSLEDFTPHFQEALKALRVGEKATFWLPQESELDLLGEIVKARIVDIEIISSKAYLETFDDKDPPLNDAITRSGLGRKQPTDNVE